MIRTERAEGKVCYNVDGMQVTDSIRVRTYKHKQAQGRKGKGSRMAHIEAIKVAQIDAIDKSLAKQDRAKAQRDARRAKRAK